MFCGKVEVEEIDVMSWELDTTVATELVGLGVEELLLLGVQVGLGLNNFWIYSFYLTKQFSKNYFAY